MTSAKFLAFSVAPFPYLENEGEHSASLKGCEEADGIYLLSARDSACIDHAFAFSVFWCFDIWGLADLGGTD